MEINSDIIVIMLIFGISLILLIFFVSTFIIYGSGKIQSLKLFSSEISNYPRISIIVSALNEEKTIEKGMKSLLELDYPNKEIIIIDDRSTDSTWDIINQISKSDDCVKPFQITKLPKGWLGKNHALQFGAKQSSGEYLLFTDADVVFEKSSLKRAVNFMVKNNCDHLGVIFDFIEGNYILNSIVLQIMSSLLLLLRPWNSHNKNKFGFIGVGAFNLLKKNVYDSIKNHNNISMEVADDLALGYLIKQKGFNQNCLKSSGLVKVAWYKSISEMIKGTEKNVFSVLNYSLIRFFIVLVLSITTMILPLWFVIILPFSYSWPFLCIVIIRILTLYIIASRGSISPISAFFIIISDYIVIYMLINSVFKTVMQKGIVWRDTFYSIKDLKSTTFFK